MIASPMDELILFDHLSNRQMHVLIDADSWLDKGLWNGPLPWLHESNSRA